MGQLESLHTQWEDLRLRLGPRNPGAGDWPRQAGGDGELPSVIRVQKMFYKEALPRR